MIVYNSDKRSYVDEDYSFTIIPESTVTADMEHLIGSWMIAASVCHLFHVCDTKYAGHMALNEFYEDFPDKIDAITEHYLAENDNAHFVPCIVPEGNPISYLERLLELTDAYCKNNEVPSAYQSQIDDIVNFTQGILYKLKRLKK